MINENAKKSLYLKYACIGAFLIALGLIVWALDWNILFFIQDYIRNDFLDVVVPF